MKMVSGEAAAVLGDALLLADLHLGIEYELQARGAQMPLQYREAAGRINALLKETKAKQLIILGDAKHDVYGMEDKERRMMNAFFSLLKTKGITVTKGNHDSQLEQASGISVVKELAVEEKNKKYLLLHGHALPKETEYDTLLLGHCHPLIELREGEKYVWRDKAWIIGEKFVVFPAFGQLVGGKPFNSGKPLTPLITEKQADEAEAFLLNGSKLGRIRVLRQ